MRAAATPSRAQAKARLATFAVCAVLAMGTGCGHWGKSKALRYDAQANEAWRSGQVELALEYCLRAVKEDPTCSDAWLTQAMIALETSRRDDGIDLLREALFHDPENARARARLATELLRSGDASAALAECRRAIRSDPDYAATWFVMGLACERLGDGGAAVACYWKGLALEPGAADFFERLRELTPSS